MAEEYSVGGTPQRSAPKTDEFRPATDLLDSVELARRISALEKEDSRKQHWLQQLSRRVSSLEEDRK